MCAIPKHNSARLIASISSVRVPGIELPVLCSAVLPVLLFAFVRYLVCCLDLSGTWLVVWICVLGI